MRACTHSPSPHPHPTSPGHVRGYNREAKLYVLEFENEREEGACGAFGG